MKSLGAGRFPDGFRVNNRKARAGGGTVTENLGLVEEGAAQRKMKFLLKSIDKRNKLENTLRHLIAWRFIYG